MKTFRHILLVILFTLVLSEGVLQVSHYLGPRLSGVIEKIDRLSGSNPFIAYSDSDYWKRRFIEAYEAGRLDGRGLMHGTHLPHETRGWTPRPDLSLIRDGYRYTTNHLGQRALKEYVYDKAQYQVLIVGDSYTFGIDADDACVWPTMLQQMDHRLNVINLAVGGYGIDQMAITLQETIDFYRPNLVIAALVGEDVWRATLDFRDYQKPKFEIEGDRLVLTHTPIGGLEAVYRETLQEVRAKRAPDLKYIRLDNLFRNMYAAIRQRSAGDAVFPYKLFSLLLERMRDTSGRAGAEFLAVYLAAGPEINNPKHSSPEEAAFLDIVGRLNVPHLDTRPYFLQRDGHYISGHYRAAEAEQVSTLVYGSIQRLASFRRFTEAGKDFYNSLSR